MDFFELINDLVDTIKDFIEIIKDYQDIIGWMKILLPANKKILFVVFYTI